MISCTSRAPSTVVVGRPRQREKRYALIYLRISVAEIADFTQPDGEHDEGH